jgi:S-adenosylmethionine decarboxylase proenzyme
MRPESKVIELRPGIDAGSGIHLLGEWYGCGGHRELLDNSAQLSRLCLAAAKEAGMTVVGQLFHEFGQQGVTGTVLLTESHLTIHTRPDERSVMLDVYISRRTRGNRVKAHAVYMFLRGQLLPGKENLLQVNRGSVAETVHAPH